MMKHFFLVTCLHCSKSTIQRAGKKGQVVQNFYQPMAAKHGNYSKDGTPK